MDRTEIKPGMIVTYKEEHIGSVTWIEGMEEYIGKLFLVLDIDDGDNTALCECMGELMLWLEIDWLGISNREFADRAGLTASTICRYLNRERIPKADAVLKCAKALGVTCDYLLGLSDDPHKTGKQGRT